MALFMNCPQKTPRSGYCCKTQEAVHPSLLGVCNMEWVDCGQETHDQAGWWSEELEGNSPQQCDCEHTEED